jgi:hypothetical protein
MARSAKKGIGYFSMDVDIFADRKLRRVLHAHGAGAMAVVLRALCCVYGENGYYAEADGDFYFDISEELALDEAYVRGVIESCAAAGVFDASLFDKRRVLTSHRIQRNYMDATRKRLHVTIDAELNLLDKDEIEALSQEGNPAEETRNPPEETRIPAEETRVPAEVSVQSTQSKVKKNKQEKSKEETKTHRAGGGAVSSPDSLVCLSSSERAALTAEFGAAATARMIEMLGSYKGASGKRYKSDYCAIKSWVVKRWREENARGPTAAHFAFERPTENYDHLAINFLADGG